MYKLLRLVKISASSWSWGKLSKIDSSKFAWFIEFYEGLVITIEKLCLDSVFILVSLQIYLFIMYSSKIKLAY